MPYDLNLRGTRVVVHAAPNRRRDAELRRVWPAIADQLSRLSQRNDLTGLVVVVAGRSEDVARLVILECEPHTVTAATVRADLFTETLRGAGSHELAAWVSTPTDDHLLPVVLCIGRQAYVMDLEVSKASTALPAVALT